jgi:Helix-turn-helix domain
LNEAFLSIFMGVIFSPCDTVNHEHSMFGGGRMRTKPTLSIAERILAGGNLTVDEFAALAGICRVTVYNEVSAGRLNLTKIGKSSRIAAPDAFAWRDARRSSSESREVA